MSVSVLSLPIPLILLVHLHILEYPYANRPEYDHNVFERRIRGLKERTKSLEDVSYFLVEQLEGSARTILSTYPCVAPSDTVAFRTSLSKYLETLRHNSLYSTSKPVLGSTIKPKAKDSAKSGDNLAWWWKDVVVRKSLLEECSGERFERILLSLTTHALLRSVPASIGIKLESLNARLRSQPTTYTVLLRACKTRRHAWAQSASLLHQREVDLKLLRERLRSQGSKLESKFSALSTERLVALVDSKYQDVLSLWWPGQDGQTALNFLAMASRITVTASTQMEGNPSNRTVLLDVPPDPKHPLISPQPLPIAAAHHPSNLKKIRKPVFSSVKPIQSGNAPVSTKPSQAMAVVAVSDRLESESRMHQALAEAVAKVKMVGRDLAERSKLLENRRRKKPTPPNATFTLNLWQPDQEPPINFKTKVTPELLASFSLSTTEQAGSLETHIDDIRTKFLPAYPPVPNLSAPRIPHPEAPRPRPTGVTSKIPHRSKHPSSRPVTPPPPLKSSNNRLLTSTPPLTIKPASRPSRKVIPGHVDTHTKQPAKVPRMSIRLSLAAHPRPSLFGEDDPDSDVNRIIFDTQDHSMEQDLDPMTPKPKATPVHRIFTGTRNGSTIKRPKQPLPMLFREPARTLPSLVSGSLSFDELREHSDSGDDEYMPEAPSMTLKDILLKADTTQFVLLDHEQDDIVDESFDWE